ncbi:MAG: type II toxin-antitoxin system YoeB family toxin [Propionibacteriaceae bacterium]|nr:type II toxin-antitoxin system YoeB family toxin [Propionibacteriaceae bacterium]
MTSSLSSLVGPRRRTVERSLVYRAAERGLEIISCRYHYSE